MKEIGLKESDGEEAFNMIVKEILCLMENGWMMNNQASE